MKLNYLKIPKDAQTHKEIKKQKTVFEIKRAAAKTYTELVALGYEEEMEFPEAWAEHVLEQRKKL